MNRTDLTEDQYERLYGMFHAANAQRHTGEYEGSCLELDGLLLCEGDNAWWLTTEEDA
jgi:hypothetical protein